MKLTKQRLAEAAQRELEEAIRRNPLDWVDEIMASVEEPEVELRAIIMGQYADYVAGPRTLIGALVEKFAISAGQQAYDVILSHPGHL